MNWDIIEGKWKQLKGSALNQWGKLTEDEVDQVAGNRQKLVGLLQERYGMAKDEAERQIDDFAERQKELL
ncbi:CsbD family protein [Phaeobacter sp. B1627]|uniref:CsbD family protein n=1 Tax=Phaeobacter sp. B1627 TaxID=2583809 RepID=UPI001119485D|nr:CsbD family protein [Phaeobacter sp. B1627]TNJ43978.1 CsbD family protein [Phaeobacter sp. B1627]